MIGDPFVECKELLIETDPCYPSPCARNGICRVTNGRATCTYPECVQNEDCISTKACLGQHCRDPCAGACGTNALCNVVNHKAVCSCPNGFYGSPFEQCLKQYDPPPRPECVRDDECSKDMACINQKCANPCSSSNTCGINSDCRVQAHRPFCVCRNGYTGNAHQACYEGNKTFYMILESNVIQNLFFSVGCRSDSECPPTEACVNKECINPCSYTQCGRNAYCKTDFNHRARCHCLDGYRGNPLLSCERPECTTNDDCPQRLSCKNEKCIDPCNCGTNAECVVDYHIASCKCPVGYSGNPSISCTRDVIKPKGCQSDAECPSKLACYSGDCKNPCTETKPCGANAKCSVVDTLPLRTMICTCFDGYIGDAEKGCQLGKSLYFQLMLLHTFMLYYTIKKSLKSSNLIN